MMTARQQQVWAIVKAANEHGTSPSYDEICQRLDPPSKSKGWLAVVVATMVARGFLNRTAKRGVRTLVAVTPPIATGTLSSDMLAAGSQKLRDLLRERPDAATSIPDAEAVASAVYQAMQEAIPHG